MQSQRFHVLSRSIPFVAFPTIMGMRVGRLDHQTVAPFLGNNRRRADRRFDTVTTHNRTRRPYPIRTAPFWRLIAIDQYLVRRPGKFVR